MRSICVLLSFETAQQHFENVYLLPGIHRRRAIKTARHLPLGIGAYIQLQEVFCEAADIFLSIENRREKIMAERLCEFVIDKFCGT